MFYYIDFRVLIKTLSRVFTDCKYLKLNYVKLIFDSKLGSESAIVSLGVILESQGFWFKPHWALGQPRDPKPH